MRQLIFLFIYTFTLFTSLFVSAQTKQDSNAPSYLDMQWKQVATKMPEEWYGSNEAIAVAENILFCQYEIGGWAKNKPYHHPISDTDKVAITQVKTGIGATFDNGATITELNFLARVYAKTNIERYHVSFLKGVNYIFEAQYSNGGWPQFFPFRKGKTVSYASHITFNDNAMVNVLTFLRDIVDGKDIYAPMKISTELKNKARVSFDRGVECILKTQIIKDGKPTVWCAQHDEFTFAPANARAYELASFSGGESASIVLFLMAIENPSKEVVDAVKCAVTWFENHKIEGIKLNPITDKDGNKDLIVIEDKNAPALWARFYDLETEKPFFCDRDGIKRNSFAELGYNRRNGYGWYTEAPAKPLKAYSEWKKQFNID